MGSRATMTWFFWPSELSANNRVISVKSTGLWTSRRRATGTWWCPERTGASLGERDDEGRILSYGNVAAASVAAATDANHLARLLIDAGFPRHWDTSARYHSGRLLGEGLRPGMGG